MLSIYQYIEEEYHSIPSVYIVLKKNKTEGILSNLLD